MAQVSVIGRITADVEVKASSKGHPYVSFPLVEWNGTGRYRRMQMFEVWAFGLDAERLADEGVRKDSRIRVNGVLELEDVVLVDNRTREQRMKIYLSDWHFADADVEIISGNVGTDRFCVPIIDGEREPLP